MMDNTIMENSNAILREIAHVKPNPVVETVANDIIATLFKSTVPETKKQFWVGPFCITVNIHWGD